MACLSRCYWTPFPSPSPPTPPLGVRTGTGKPGKSRDLILTFPKTGKSWKKTGGPGNLLNSSIQVFRINAITNVCSHKENWFLNLGNVRFKVKFGVLKKSLKFYEKGTNPASLSSPFLSLDLILKYGIHTVWLNVLKINSNFRSLLWNKGNR